MYTNCKIKFFSEHRQTSDRPAGDDKKTKKAELLLSGDVIRSDKSSATAHSETLFEPPIYHTPCQIGENVTLSSGQDDEINSYQELSAYLQKNQKTPAVSPAL